RFWPCPTRREALPCDRSKERGHADERPFFPIRCAAATAGRFDRAIAPLRQIVLDGAARERVANSDALLQALGTPKARKLLPVPWYCRRERLCPILQF